MCVIRPLILFSIKAARKKNQNKTIVCNPLNLKMMQAVLTIHVFTKYAYIEYCAQFSSNKFYVNNASTTIAIFTLKISLNWTSQLNFCYSCISIFSSFNLSKQDKNTWKIPTNSVELELCFCSKTTINWHKKFHKGW